jgi:NurA-like 5'-3' nuclease
MRLNEGDEVVSLALVDKIDEEVPEDKKSQPATK